MKAEFFLTWFSAEPNEDHLVGEEKMPELTEEQVRQWFWMQDDEECLDGHIVRASQQRYLQPLVAHQIDLNKYDYFVEHTVDNSKEHT